MVLPKHREIFAALELSADWKQFSLPTILGSYLPCTSSSDGVSRSWEDGTRPDAI